MNIFVTNENPVLAARDLCDQHVKSKMQIEGAIMLAHAFPQEVLNHPSTPRTKTGKPRKSGKGYYKHCCSIWARQTQDNFMWLVEHTLEQFNERYVRLPNAVEHFTKDFIVWCSKNLHNTTITQTGLTPFAIAINDTSICRKHPNFASMSTIDKYRCFIIYDKPFATWTNREKPEWFNNPLQYGHLLFSSHSHQLEHQAA